MRFWAYVLRVLKNQDFVNSVVMKEIQYMLFAYFEESDVFQLVIWCFLLNVLFSSRENNNITTFLLFVEHNSMFYDGKNACFCWIWV